MEIQVHSVAYTSASPIMVTIITHVARKGDKDSL